MWKTAGNWHLILGISLNSGQWQEFNINHTMHCAEQPAVDVPTGVKCFLTPKRVGFWFQKGSPLKRLKSQVHQDSKVIGCSHTYGKMHTKGEPRNQDRRKEKPKFNSALRYFYFPLIQASWQAQVSADSHVCLFLILNFWACRWKLASSEGPTISKLLFANHLPVLVLSC